MFPVARARRLCFTHTSQRCCKNELFTEVCIAGRHHTCTLTTQVPAPLYPSGPRYMRLCILAIVPLWARLGQPSNLQGRPAVVFDCGDIEVVQHMLILCWHWLLWFCEFAIESIALRQTVLFTVLFVVHQLYWSMRHRFHRATWTWSLQACHGARNSTSDWRCLRYSLHSEQHMETCSAWALNT